MSKTIFDHLKGITKEKIPWDSLSDSDKKSWDDFMITRWLSMKMEYVEFLNELQLYRSGELKDSNYYNFLLHTLPAETSYYKYIKRPRVFETHKKILEFFSSVYKVSHRESLDIIKTFRILKLESEFNELLIQYGIQESEKEELRKELFDEKK
jgi:hypothetical protein